MITIEQSTEMTDANMTSNLPQAPRPAKRKATPSVRKKGSADRLGREDWVRVARRFLIRTGIESIKVERLATELAVTTGSFYWHFKKLSDLHEALLSDWYETNTASFHRAVAGAGSDPRQQYLVFLGTWVLEQDFDPRYDRAIRDWARHSKKVAALLSKVDADRMNLLQRIFDAFGYSCLEAEVRARVAYYHQVGYYALDAREPRDVRVGLGPGYAKILTGYHFLESLSLDDLKQAYAGRYVFREPFTI